MIYFIGTHREEGIRARKTYLEKLINKIIDMFRL